MYLIANCCRDRVISKIFSPCWRRSLFFSRSRSAINKRIHSIVSVAFTVRGDLDSDSQSTMERHHTKKGSISMPDAPSSQQLNSIKSHLVSFSLMLVALIWDKLCKEAPQSSSLQCHWLRLLFDRCTGLCSPVTPSTYWCLVFVVSWTLYLDIAASLWLVAGRCSWPSMNKEVHVWDRQCLQRKRYKVHRNLAPPVGTFIMPDLCFDQDYFYISVLQCHHADTSNC